MKTAFKILFLLLLIGGTAWILIDANTAPYRKMEGKIFGTFYHITYQSSTDYDADVLAALEEVDASLSAFNPQSTVSKVNRNEAVKVDALFQQVFDEAMAVSAATDGAFDVTVAPLVNLWGFGFSNSGEVTQTKIDSIMPFVGYKKVRKFESSKVKKDDERMMLDFSAIAKGFGCDRVAALLDRHGIGNFLIEIGGEIVARGLNPDHQAWTVGVERPDTASLPLSRGAGGSLVATLQMSPLALATSGNYRNFYVKDGQCFAHTIDPKTGRPVQHSLLSATVIAPSCALADAYATAFMVMGLEKAQALLAKDARLKAFLIYSDGDQTKTWHSPTLDKYLE